MKRSKTIGVAQALAGYGWWGFVTVLYYHWLKGIDPFELVSWRVVSAIPVVFILIVVTNSFGEFKEAILKWKNLRWLVVSALLILVNWLAFIWAVVSENIIHASLGYYLNPLVSIALSALILKERLRPAQWVSVGIAGIGVLLLTTMVGLPWIAITLGVTFPLYGLIRKKCPSSATVGLTVEMILLLPVMTVVLVWMTAQGGVGHPDRIDASNSTHTTEWNRHGDSTSLLFGSSTPIAIEHGWNASIHSTNGSVPECGSVLR